MRFDWIRYRIWPVWRAILNLGRIIRAVQLERENAAEMKALEKDNAEYMQSRYMKDQQRANAEYIQSRYMKDQQRANWKRKRDERLGITTRLTDGGKDGF